MRRLFFWELLVRLIDSSYHNRDCHNIFPIHAFDQRLSGLLVKSIEIIWKAFFMKRQIGNCIREHEFQGITSGIISLLLRRL